MLRAVADTNVYISALNFGGVPDDVLALARHGLIALFISPSILQEVEGVLCRKFEWRQDRIREAAALIRGFAVELSPLVHLDVITEDEPDNRILECAVAADTAFIVTGDRHLRRLARYRGIVILTPSAFLTTFAQQ
jgi:putative PIN family toxin of toxin-antitoxin system